MPKLKLSWQQKLADDKDLPRVEEITGRMSTKWGTGTSASLPPGKWTRSCGWCRAAGSSPSTGYVR